MGRKLRRLASGQNCRIKRDSRADAARSKGSSALSRQIAAILFVLSGVATLEIEGKREVLQKHEGAEVLPNVPHQMFNESEQAIEFLVISQPASHGDRFSG